MVVVGSTRGFQLGTWWPDRGGVDKVTDIGVEVKDDPALRNLRLRVVGVWGWM